MEKKTMMVFLDDEGKPRKQIEVEVLKEGRSTYTVRLPDGNVIKRKKNRDVVR